MCCLLAQQCRIDRAIAEKGGEEGKAVEEDEEATEDEDGINADSDDEVGEEAVRTKPLRFRGPAGHARTPRVRI